MNIKKIEGEIKSRKESIIRSIRSGHGRMTMDEAEKIADVIINYRLGGSIERINKLKDKVHKFKKKHGLIGGNR